MFIYRLLCSTKEYLFTICVQTDFHHSACIPKCLFDLKTITLEFIMTKLYQYL